MTVHDMIARLQAAKVHFNMATYRETAVMFSVSVPGQRWELEVFDDGHVEIETFVSDGSIFDEAQALTLISAFSDE